MLKNIIILLAFALLIVSSSNLSTVSAQTSSAKIQKKTVQTNSEDYHRTVNERFVIESLKDLYKAEAEYTIYAGGGNYGTFIDLYLAGLIDPVLASHQKYGYYYWMTYWNAGNGSPPAFAIYAVPVHYGRTGRRSFFIDASCWVRGEDNGGVDTDEDGPVIDTCSPYLSFQWEIDMSQGMKSLQTAQVAYFNGVGNGEYGTLDDLIKAGLINYFIAYNWYTWLTIDLTPATKSSAAGYRMWAVPQIYRQTGIRSFYADETGVLRGADLGGVPADENTPLFNPEDEDAVKHAMRSLWRAQRNYRGLWDISAGFYAVELSTLTRSGMIDIEFPGDTFGGYQFEMVVDNNEDPRFRLYEIRATPLVYGKGTSRSFYISDKSMLRGADKGGGAAGVDDPVIEF